jgi:hypothetical protein
VQGIGAKPLNRLQLLHQSGSLHQKQQPQQQNHPATGSSPSTISR